MTPKSTELSGDVPSELRLEVPAVHAGARLARHLIRPFARSNGVSGRDLDGLLFVAEELLTNAIDHGGGEAAREVSDLAAPVRMSLKLTIAGRTWEMRVADQGGGDPEALDRMIQADELPDLDEERGRGFFLLKQFVDRLNVERSEDGRGLVVIAGGRHGTSA